MIEGIGGELRGLLVNAQDAARSRRQELSTAHLLLAMLQTDGEVAGLLTKLGVRETELLGSLKSLHQEPNTALDISLERARKTAVGLGEKTPRGAHLLWALMRESRSAAHQCLNRSGTNAKKVETELAQKLGMAGARARSFPSSLPPAMPAPRVSPPAGASPLADSRRTHAHPMTHTLTPRHPQRASQRVIMPKNKKVDAAPQHADVAPEAFAIEEMPNTNASPFELDRRSFPLLSSIGRNLTLLAAEGHIDPVIGRDAEIETLFDILARRRANNPLLVGPPGVGKTAIVEGLAQKLVDNHTNGGANSPRVVIEISSGALVSGTGVRGALADKLARMRAEVAQSDGRVLLFLDEIHSIVGGHDGPDDLSNELKSSLARGELPCIGATTEAEYKKHFEKDPALVRRFSRVDVAEPKPADAVRILRGLIPRYEAHHCVAYTKDAIEQAVALSVRFMPDQKLPDKAISILDLAAARVRRREKAVVDVEAIAEVVSEQAHVPLERLLMKDGDRLLRLESFLGERVVGQKNPISRIADALRKGAAGFRGERPLGTFLLLGPTGVGKTETAKAVSELLFASTDMTRLDMSEYAEAHAVARLLGAPPGYVGHDDGGQLTEAVRRRPYQLVLLDEIEKAHPDVLLALLPLLDEGRLTDGRGRTVDFKNTVIVMTSNLGAVVVKESTRIGFGSDASNASTGDGERALMSARRALPPELWNRIDEPLWFAPLGRFEVAQIADRMLEKVVAVMQDEHGIDVEYDDATIDALIDAGGFDATLGARPMRRIVSRLVEASLATAVLGGTFTRGDAIMLVGEGSTIRLERGLNLDAAE
jgi:ATP-dependent Clp protease ATP-binding subunit ClpC